MKKEITSTTKTVYIIIGILLLVGNFRGNLTHLLNWNTPEQSGRNIYTLITTLIGIYLLYISTRKSSSKN